MTADPADSQDIAELRHEILRLRDQVVGAEARNKVLEDRVMELEDENARLDALSSRLHEELARSPVIRIARRIASCWRRQ